MTRPRRSWIWMVQKSTSRRSATRRAPTASSRSAQTRRRRSPQVDEDHDDTRLQLGQVRRPEAAKTTGRLVPGPSPACETLRRRRALYCTPRRPGARRRTSATRPKAPARSSSRTARRPRSTRGAASSKPLRLLLDGVWGVLEPSESRVHLHAIDATSARSRGIYNTRRPRDALIDVLRRPATATSWTSPTCRRSSATRRSSCTSSRSR